MKITKQEQHNKTTTPNITWFTPSVGATSTNCVLFLFLQKPQFICALSCRFLLPLDSRAHSSRLLRTQLQTFLTFLQKPSAHTAAEVVYAHSWDLSFPCQKPILLHLIFLTSKILTYPFSISAYLYCAAYKNHGPKPWAPTKTLTLELIPWVYYKKRGF